MEERRYNVIFLGPDNTDKEYVDRLMDELMDRFHLSPESVRKMMLLAPVTVKREVSLIEAERYKKVLEGMGASVKIDPVGSTEADPDEDSVVPAPSYEEESTQTWEAASEEESADEWVAAAPNEDTDSDGFYNVIFTGMVDDSDATMQRVAEALEADFGLSSAQAAKVVRSPGSVLKQMVPYGQAISYWVDMEAVGGQVALESTNGQSATRESRRTREESPGFDQRKGTGRKSYVVLLGLVIVIAGAVAAWRWFQW